MVKDYPIILANPEERAAERDANTDCSDLSVVEVEEGSDGWYYLTFGDEADKPYSGFTCGILWPDDKPVPEVGNRLRLWGAGLGKSLSGASLLTDSGLVSIFYKTKREKEVEAASRIADSQRRQREQFEKGHASLDALYEQLPDPLKRRIDRFRAGDPNFRWNSESYEMAACAEAGRLYRRAMDPAFGVALKAAGVIGPSKEGVAKPSYSWEQSDGTLDWDDTPENRLRAFDAINSKLNDYKFDLMKQIMPEMDDGHSGNTWGHAFMFAVRLVRGEGDLL